MSVKKILRGSIDLILENLYKAKSIYDSPIDYLDYILQRKYERFEYTDQDWQIVAEEKEELEKIKFITAEAIGIAERLKKKAPAKDIISAAKDLRKLEVIYDLGLITTSEKAKEQKAIEQYLGIKTSEEPKKTPSAPQETPRSPPP